MSFVAMLHLLHNVTNEEQHKKLHWVWFLFLELSLCSMSIHPRHAFSSTALCTIHVSWAYLCPVCVPVLFTNNTRCWFVIVCYGFPLALLWFSLTFSEETWIHCIALSNVELLHLVEGRQRRQISPSHFLYNSLVVLISSAWRYWNLNSRY